MPKKVRIDEYKEALSFVQNTREEFLKNVEETIRNTDSFESFAEYFFRKASNSEIANYISANLISDKTLIQALQFRDIFCAFDFFMEITGVMCRVTFYVSDYHDYYHNVQRYKINCISVSAFELEIYSELLDITIQKKKIYSVDEAKIRIYKMD